MSPEWIAVIIAFGALTVAIWQVRSQNEIGHEQLRVSFYLELRKQFDSEEFRRDRRYLAEQFLAKYFQEGHIAPPSYDEILEPVMNFFEDMGALVRRGYLDEGLIKDTFSYFGSGWWNASEDYIMNERKTHDDTSLFSDFEVLVEAWKELKTLDNREFLHEELKP